MDVCFAMVISLCVDVMAMSSALVVRFAGARGVGVPDVYMLKSVGDSTPPCGTPFLNWCCVDVLFLNVVYALRPLISVSLCALPGKKGEVNGTSTHLLDGYISANQRFFSTFLSKITKYNQAHLGFDPSVARLLCYEPTPDQLVRSRCQEININVCLIFGQYFG